MSHHKKHQSFLATSQKKFLKVGFAIAILAVIGAFNLTFHQEVKAYAPLITEFEDVFQGEEISYIKEKIEVPVVQEKQVITNAYVITTVDFDPVEKKEINIDIDIDVIDPSSEGLGTEVITETDIKKPTSFPEVMPIYPGGENALFSYLSKIAYCQQAIDLEMQGKVYVQFIVNEKGKVKDAKVMRSVYPCLDNAALEIVQNMPDWSPGMQGFESVPVIMTVPINFVLN